MEILLTNDDGIHSDGLHLLAESLKKIAEVIIVAPDSQRSAVAASLSLHKPLRLKEIKNNVFISDGTPADCVSLGLHSVLKNKSSVLVVSGINAGANMGEDVFYSGTVGAVIEARMHSVSGLAVSMRPDSNNKFSFNIAAKYAAKIVKKFFFDNLNKSVRTLNLNIPAVKSLKEIKGLKVTKLDNRKYPPQIIERKDTAGHSYYWLGGAPPVWKNSADSDYNAIINNYASITPLILDITDYKILESFKNNFGDEND